MKVYTISCYGGKYDESYEYLSSIHATFEGAKKEVLRLAKEANDTELNEWRKLGISEDDIAEHTEVIYSVLNPSDDTATFFKLTRYNNSAWEYIEMGPEEVRDD